jgi:hypothetical protein
MHKSGEVRGMHGAEREGKGEAGARLWLLYNKEGGRASVEAERMPLMAMGAPTALMATKCARGRRENERNDGEELLPGPYCTH